MGGMVAHFQVDLGRGHAGAHLTLDRVADQHPRRRRWLLLVAVALTLPFAVALALAGLSSAIPGFRTQGPIAWLTGGRHVGLALAYGPPLALLILIFARVRMHFSRGAGRWSGRVEARLELWEVMTALLALAVAGIFFGHLAADAWACANGVRSAC